MTDNYLAVGRMRVAGKVIAPKPVAADETLRFDVAVPGSYVIWADGDVIPGTLDGTPNTDPRELKAGPPNSCANGAFAFSGSDIGRWFEKTNSPHLNCSVAGHRRIHSPS